MKKFSVLSFFLIIVGLCACVSCGYLISTAIVTSNLFQYTSVVSCDDQTVYAISMKSGATETELSSFKQELQAQNGAGYVCEKDDKFYLIASIYENFNDAELVKNNLQASGIETEILTIELEKSNVEGNFSADEKTVLTNCLKSKIETFKELYDVAISLDTNVFDKTKAKLECNTIYSENVSTKANFDTYFKESNNKTLQSLQSTLTATNNCLSNLISENYDTTTQTFSSLIKQTYCKILLG